MITINKLTKQEYNNIGKYQIVNFAFLKMKKVFAK